jgi:Fe-S-cluster containining protein
MAEFAKPRHERAQRDPGGRVHLTVHRDPTSGEGLLRLKSALFDQSWQNEVAESAANTALGVLSPGLTRERVLALTRSAMASTSRLVDGLLARAPRGAVACKAGCDHCCHVVVAVTAPEALTILDYLKRTLGAPALTQLTARVAEFHERTRALSSDQRFSPEYPCVFLEAGRCSIYEVRPFACRGMNSLDAGECETRLRDPAVRADFVENGGGHLFVEPIRAFRAVSAGIQLALAELFGLDMRPLELSAVMNLLLSGGSSLAEAWISGQQPFEDARCGAPIEITAGTS